MLSPEWLAQLGLPASIAWKPFVPPRTEPAVDRTAEDVRVAVHVLSGGHGVAAVFDSIGVITYETGWQLLAPRGCPINYHELFGPVSAINLLHLFGICVRHQVQRQPLGRRVIPWCRPRNVRCHQRNCRPILS